MMPVVYINCSGTPFLRDIMRRRKLDETRTRDTLRAVTGVRVYLAETGNGPAVVRCMATIHPGRRIESLRQWRALRSRTRVPVGSRYDWKPGTIVKWAYAVADVVPVTPFLLPSDAVRHGRVWAEYNEQEEK